MIPVSGPQPGGKAWLLPPAALSSRCPHGSAAFTQNTVGVEPLRLPPGKSKALRLSQAAGDVRFSTELFTAL